MAAADIVVEDGTGLADANSYISIAEARQFALMRGVTLAPAGGAGDDTVATMLIQSTDWVESFRLEFVGTPTFPTVQALSWPRTVCKCGTNVDLGVPAAIKNAQAHAIMAVKAGVDLLPVVDPSVAAVTKEKVGQLEVAYAAPNLAALAEGPQLTAAKGCLEPLLLSYAVAGLGFKTIRV